MQKLKLKQKINLIIMLIIYLVSVIGYRTFSLASTEIEPEESQYLELKATTINKLEDGTQQVIMELWGHEIDFKRIPSKIQI